MTYLYKEYKIQNKGYITSVKKVLFRIRIFFMSKFFLIGLSEFQRFLAGLFQTLSDSRKGSPERDRHMNGKSGV